MNTTTLNLLDKVYVTTEYAKQDIWNALVGSDFANTYHWISAIAITDHLNISTLNKPTDLTIRYTEPTSGADSLAIITPKEIYLAFAQLVSKKSRATIWRCLATHEESYYPRPYLHPQKRVFTSMQSTSFSAKAGVRVIG